MCMTCNRLNTAMFLIVTMTVSSPDCCCNWFSLHACPSACSIVRLLVRFCRVDELYITGCAAKSNCAVSTNPQYCPAAVKCFSERIIDMIIKDFYHVKLVFGFTESVCVCVRVRVCVSCMTCSVYVSVLSCEMLQSCAWSGDVMMSRGFLVSLLSLFLCLVKNKN